MGRPVTGRSRVLCLPVALTLHRAPVGGTGRAVTAHATHTHGSLSSLPVHGRHFTKERNPITLMEQVTQVKL